MVVSATALFAARNAGQWLVVADPLQSARAIVVLGGQVPFRAMEAAAIYGQGLAPEVWVTQSAPSDEDHATAALGIDRPPDHVYSVKVLERLGVPDTAIRVLGDHDTNTADEIRTVARELRARNGARVILVTSKYHSRRVRSLWRSLVGRTPEAVVRHAPGDPFEPDRWWRTTGDAVAVAREWCGLLNAWVGSPVKSTR